MIVDSMPMASPLMMLVAGPVWDASAILLTGTSFVNQSFADVYHSVTRPMRIPAMVPARIATKVGTLSKLAQIK